MKETEKTYFCKDCVTNRGGNCVWWDEPISTAVVKCKPWKDEPIFCRCGRK